MRWSRPLGIMARFRLADEWEKALAVPEQWAVETTRRAAFVAEAIQAGLDAEALLEVLTAVSSNLDHARALLSAAISQPGGNIIRLLPRADWARELPDNIVAAISALVSRDRIEDAS